MPICEIKSAKSIKECSNKRYIIPTRVLSADFVAVVRLKFIAY